ncbi:hypothetical protein PC39_08284 [Salinisphaera sp. PC39]
MVVYIHGTTVGFTSGDWSDPSAWIQGYLSHNLFHVSLLIFFFCSAFLLFVGVDGIGDIGGKLRKRGRSLIVPYLLWSGLWLVVLLLARLVGNLDLGAQEAPSGVEAVLYRLFVDPVAGQLWFLRDLIVLTALSPLLFVLPRWVGPALLAAAYVVWLWVPTPTVIENRSGWWEIVSTEAIVWFLAGVVAARFLDLDKLDRILRDRRAWVSLASCVGYLLLPLAKGGPFMPASVAFGLSTTLGFVFLVSLYPWIARLVHSEVVARFGSFSFLLYAGHYPTLKIVGLSVVAILGPSAEVALATYALAPLVVIIGVIFGLSVLGRVWPGAVLALNGYRPVYPFLASRTVK